ncbi:MAG: dephospho-CoA kinase [Chloroflexota bacterium]
MGESSTGKASFVLGLTGGIACGKSTVGAMLLEMGARERIDADSIVHALLRTDTETVEAIRKRFGAGVLQADGTVDRKRLADVVFGQTQELAALEKLLHPAVRAHVLGQLAATARERGIIIVDAVKLLQSDLLDLCDAVWVVRCSPSVQMKRLIQVRHMTESEARNRVAAQPPFDHASVTLVIDNSSSMEQLRRDVERAWSSLGLARPGGATESPIPVSADPKPRY